MTRRSAHCSCCARSELGGGGAREQRQIQIRLDAGLGGTDVGDGVDAMVGGDDDPWVPYQAFGNRLWLQPLEREAHVGVAGDLDLEALARLPEVPGRF